MGQLAKEKKDNAERDADLPSVPSGSLGTFKVCRLNSLVVYSLTHSLSCVLFVIGWFTVITASCEGNTR